MVDLPARAITLKPSYAAISGDVGHAGRGSPEDFEFSIGIGLRYIDRRRKELVGLIRK